MRNAIFETGLVLLLSTCLFFSGCGAPAASSDSGKDSEIRPENCIRAQAIVHYLHGDRGQYFTEQEHLFCRNAKTLQIRSPEPSGLYVWQVSEQKYHASPSDTEKTHSQSAVMSQPIALLIYAGFFYAGEILPTTDFVMQEPLKIEGQWYEPMQKASAGKTMLLTLYRNMDSKKIELFTVADSINGSVLSSKSYNWRYYGDDSILIPRTIDIFDISNGLASKNRLLQIDYKNVK